MAVEQGTVQEQETGAEQVPAVVPVPGAEAVGNRLNLKTVRDFFKSIPDPIRFLRY